MAQDTNVVVVTGRLAEDAMLKQSASGQPLMTFKLVNSKRRRKVNDRWEDQPPNYFSVVLWGRSAETLKPYMTKGKQLAVSGRLQQRSYQLPDESRKRSVVEIVAENVQLLGSRPSGTEGYSSGAQGGTGSSQSVRQSLPEEDVPEMAPPAAAGPDPFGPEEPVPDEDIPF
jgi:single-strand DNA-binding protein